MNILARAVYDKSDSRPRYKALLNLILEQYGSIDLESGKDLVNYHAYPAIIEGVERPEESPTYWGGIGDEYIKYVYGSRTIFDVTDLKLYTLYREYADPWVYYEMTDE